MRFLPVDKSWKLKKHYSLIKSTVINGAFWNKSFMQEFNELEEPARNCRAVAWKMNIVEALPNRASLEVNKEALFPSFQLDCSNKRRVACHVVD